MTAGPVRGASFRKHDIIIKSDLQNLITNLILIVIHNANVDKNVHVVHGTGGPRPVASQRPVCAISRNTVLGKPIHGKAYSS